jgi:DNA modification methylase
MVDRLGPYELNSIITGDVRELAKAIPDESVDLIFTDPVYQNIEDYRWLAETAARVLKPDRACLVWGMTTNFDECLEALKEYLTYRWIFMLFRSGYGSGGVPINGIVNKYTPCIWMEKGKSKTVKTIWDTSIGVTIPGEFYHRWQKDIKTTIRWVEAFTHPGATVFDPFTGGGTVPAVCKMLGRNYLAFEIEPQTAALARQRVLDTQPPLFVMPQPEQLEMVV